MTTPQPSKPALLVLNPGSSSIKWSVHHLVMLGRAEGSTAPVASGQSTTQTEAATTSLLMGVLAKYVVHTVIIRVVHGGSEYREPLEVDNAIFQLLQDLVPLAPVHNGLAIELIGQLRSSWSSIRVVAVFDTEFFSNLPVVSQSYGLPVSLIEKHRLRRYGFHGFAHEDLARQWEARNPGMTNYTLVTAQLGSGCSMAAIGDGKPMDTTMGFTPNEGLLMRTRTGDLDPGLLTWLQRQENWSPDDTDRFLNHKSGWQGLSGGIDNMADLFMSTKPQHRLAFDLFRYRFQKTLGAYFAILGGLNGVLLSGGIVENNVAIARRLLSGLSHLGVELTEQPVDPPLPLRLSSGDSPVQCWVAAADEAASMLRAVQAHFPDKEGCQPPAD